LLASKTPFWLLFFLRPWHILKAYDLAFSLQQFDQIALAELASRLVWKIVFLEHLLESEAGGLTQDGTDDAALFTEGATFVKVIKEAQNSDSGEDVLDPFNREAVARAMPARSPRLPMA